MRDQQVDHVVLAALGGEVESRCAYEVVALDATAALQEELGEIEIATPRINVILNWFEELKRLVPTGGR